MSDSLKRILGSVFYRKEEEKEAATQNALRLKSHKALFQDDLDAKLWALVDAYLLEQQSSPSLTILQALAKKALQEDTVLYVADLGAQPICGEEEFKYFLKDAFEEQKTGQFSEILSAAGLILSGSFVSSNKKDPQLKGYADAFRYVVEKGMDFVHRDSGGDRLRGNIRLEGQEMREAYLRVKENEASAVGILTGLNSIDLQTQGVRRGDLWMVVGFTSDGKSTVSLNIAHNAVTRGYNVFFVSLEMAREQLREIVYCIHTGHRKFRAAHKPLNIESIRRALLTHEEENFYFGEVIDDFERNPTYGELYIVQPEDAWNVKRLRAEAELYHRRVAGGLDLIIIDYVNMMAHDPMIRDPNEALNRTIKDLKQMANTFSNGDRVGIVSPFQSNREGRKRANENGGVYDLMACSNAHEAERSSDVVFAIYSNPELKQTKEAVISMLKGRDTGCCEPFRTFADFSCRIVSDASLPPSKEDSWVEELMLDI